MNDFYFGSITAAFVRGRLLGTSDVVKLPEHLLDKPLKELSARELEAIIQVGKTAGQKLHRFKRTMELARVQRVLGILKGVAPSSLLDIGSGRGAFLWPCLEAFPALPVMAIDQDERRVADILAVHRGGIERLSARTMDVTAMDFDADAFDVVTMLEVLEHIPNPQQALVEVVRVAKRFVIVSVPSQPDDNPEHINLFSTEILRRMFETAGAVRVRLDYVLNHLLAVAKVAS